MQILDTEQLAAMFSVSPSTVRNWVQQGMPVLRPSPGVLRFDAQSCIEWARTRTETAV